MNSRISFLIAVLLLLVLTAAMFGEALFSPEAKVLSRYGTDLSLHFIHWRKFGFEQLRQGNLALWNPHLFSGTPCLGEYQSALLYPANLLYLVLPLAKAINLSIALHIFLTGLFMYLWALHRGLHPLACFLSSVLLMFCGPYFMHAYTGSLPNLCAMAWIPLLFLSIDGYFKNRSSAWLLLGIFTVTMLILAGHPQYLFYAAVSAAVYSGLCLVKAEQRIKICRGLAAMCAGAAGLSAVQLLTLFHTAQGSVRQGGLSYKLAAMFSFPPENLVTLLAPGFFGNMKSLSYWGRCYLWEMSLFISVTGLVLAVYGAVYGKRHIRHFSIAMALMMLLLALGNHTPLFRVLYLWLPGFSGFRGSSKFIFFASCFMVMLTGIGLDDIIRRGIRRKMIVLVFILGLLLGGAALYLEHCLAANRIGWWQRIVQGVYFTYESYLPKQNYLNPDFIREAGLFSAGALKLSACTCLLLSVIFILTRSYRKWVYAIALLAVAEIFTFARGSLASFDFALTRSPALKSLSDNYKGDYRILKIRNPDNVMSFGANNIWGYDWCLSRRYAEFMAFTQGHNPDDASEYLEFSRFHKLYAMLRCRFLLLPEKGKVKIIDFKKIMPRLNLIRDWQLITGRDKIFEAMQKPDFDPYQRVILETVPEPEPVKSKDKDSVKIIDSSTDYLTVEAELKKPAILLITDGYGRGWRARALAGSIQKRYRVMPANYVLMAIPLSGGHHHLRLEYLPLTFQVGKWLSILSVTIYAGWLVWYWKRGKHKKLKG